MTSEMNMFKTFPEFSKLTMADKSAYEALIKDYPPVNDISFTALMTWWDNMDHGISLSNLNGNLVIPYYLPGDEKNSGLSLVGKHKIDESICEIFDYLRDRGEPVRLVNVPEFVVSSIQYTELFNCTEQRRYHEYVVNTPCFYPLKNQAAYKRKRVEYLLNKVGEENIVVRSLDLHSSADQKLLLDTAEEWWTQNINNFGTVQKEAITKCILQSEELGIENLCVMVNGEIYGFCLYQHTQDRRYVIIPHIKGTHKRTLGFELIGYLFAKWFAEQGITYGNLTSDRGLLRLRMFLLTLNPTNFYRKYKIEPAD